MRNSPAKASNPKPAAKKPVKPTVNDTSRNRPKAAAAKSTAKAKPALQAKKKPVAAKATQAKKTSATKSAAKKALKLAKSLASKAPTRKQVVAKKPVAAAKAVKAVKAVKATARPVAKTAPVKGKSASVGRGNSTKSSKPVVAAKSPKTKVSVKPALKAAAKKPVAKPVPKAAASTARGKVSAKVAVVAPKKKSPAPKAVPVAPAKRPVAAKAEPAKAVPVKGKSSKPLSRIPLKPLPPVKAELVAVRPPPAPLPKAPKMAEVLKSLDAAMKFFQKASFAAAEDAFEKILAKYPTQSDIVALVSRYIAICKSKLQTPQKMAQTPESFYDQGVIEMNNGNFEEAIELFKRALKSQSEAPHVLYSLAAAQVRLGNTDDGLRTLEQAVEIREIHRSKARTDPDFVALRGDVRFQELVGLGSV